MFQKWFIVIVVLLFTSSVSAGEYFEVGATYQIDRAKYNNQKIAICATEEAMIKYMEAHRSGDVATMKKMLYKIQTTSDVDKMLRNKGCTLISSFSQAKIVKKGVEAHLAVFYAFPFAPMWGYYEYFGGRVK